ncbi:MAG TPA: hypothetical protein VIL74_15155 [Pyrinomonadaceae bacterium]|jgi:hypothetical protein
MKKSIFGFLLSIIFAFTVSAQKPEARKIDEFGDHPCSLVLNAVPAYYVAMGEIPGSTLFIIYYEGKHFKENVWNKKLKSYESKWVYPRRGDALNRAKEVGLVAKDNKFSVENLVYVNGGYREKFTLEIWLVPPGAAQPEPASTLTETDVTFEKGKPVRPRLCARIYDGL